MANDNQGSRAFLAIVLGGIVLALVIAAYFMYGHKGDTGVKVEQPASEQPVETPPAPPAEPPAAEVPAAPPAMAPAEPPVKETPAPEEAPAPQNP
ncbi:MAG: hypothetical protein MUO37_07925 [Methyloceanibacter sp.]|nr:hypothetical protein [Methyloceanibacter sp.]